MCRQCNINKTNATKTEENKSISHILKNRKPTELIIKIYT